MINKESNVKKLKNLGYSQQDAEDFADEFEQGGNKVSKKINEILSDEGVYELLLNNYRNKGRERFDVGGRIVGTFYFDSRKDKTFQVISIDGMRMGIQYFDRSKKPIGDIEFINKQEFDYYIFKGAWAEYKQPYFENGSRAEIERVSMKRLLSEFKNEKEIFDGQIVNRGVNQFKIENHIFYIKRPNENWEVFRKIKYEDGGSVEKIELKKLSADRYENSFKEEVLVIDNGINNDEFSRFSIYDEILNLYVGNTNTKQQAINKLDTYVKNNYNVVNKFDNGGGVETIWGGIRGKLRISMLSFEKVDYNVNVERKGTNNYEIDVNITKNDSVDSRKLYDVAEEVSQENWGYLIEVVSFEQLYETLKVLRVRVSKDKLFSWFNGKKYEDGGSVDGGDYVREDLNLYKKGGGVEINVKPHHSSREEFNDLIEYLENNSWEYEKSEAPNMELPYILISTTNVSREEVSELKHWLSINSWDFNLQKKFDKAGGVKNNFYKKFGDDNLHLVNFDLSQLDDYEEVQFNHALKSFSKAESLQVLINSVEGDYSQLSSTLSKIAEEQYPSDEFFEENRQYVKGGNINAYQNNVDYINWQGENYIEDGGLEMQEEQYSIIKKYIDFDTIKGIVDFDDNINNSLSKSNNYDETIITANLKFLKGGKIVGELRSYTIYNNSNDEGETKESIIFKNGTLIHINYTFGNTYTGFDPKRVYEKRIIDELQKQLYFHSKKQFKTGGEIDDNLGFNYDIVIDNKPLIQIFKDTFLDTYNVFYYLKNEKIPLELQRILKGKKSLSQLEAKTIYGELLKSNQIGKTFKVESSSFKKGGSVDFVNTEVMLTENKPNGLKWRGIVKPFMLKSIEDNQYSGGFKRYEIDIYDEVDIEPTKESIEKANEFFDKVGGRYSKGGGIMSDDISEDDAKAELQKLEEKGHLFIQVDDNGKIKMQIRKTDNSLVNSILVPYDSYKKALRNYYITNYGHSNNMPKSFNEDSNDSSIEDISQELSIVVTDELSQPVPNNVDWGNFFKDNPNNILGTEQEITTKYGEKVIRVIGDSEKINEVQIPIIDSHTPIQNVETIITDNVTTNNVTPSQIKKAKKLAKNSEKSLIKTKKLIAENREYELIPFDEFDAEYNAGITDDTKSAYVFYLQKISNNKLQGGFLKYDLGTSKEAERKLMNKGVLFYDLSEVDESRRYVPLFLFQTGNIYKKKQKLESEKDFYIENFGEKIYEIHLEKINEHYNLIWNRRLTLNDVDEKRRLVINPTSDIATDINIFKVQSYMAGEYLKQSQQIYVSSVNGKEVLKPLKDTYSGKYSNRKYVYDFDLQLAFILYLKDIGGGERAKAQGVIYTDGMDYEMIYAYYLKNSPRPKTIDKDDWARIKGYASKNGKRLFAHFLQFGLLPADRERLELLWNIEYNGNLEIDTLKVPIYFQMARMFRGEFENNVRTEKRASVVFNMIKGSSLLAYGVGLGKTFCAIYNLAQNLEFGFCKRPLIILPNQVYAQFIKEINGIIPQYKINYLYNLKGVYAFLNQKIDDYSISVCTYEGLEEIAFSDNLDTNYFIRLGEILSGGEEMTRKQKEREGQKYFEIIGKAKSETSVEFDDLNTNWDYLVVDEAHNFKKLFTQVRGKAKIKTDAQIEAGANNSYEKSEYQISSGTPSDRAIRLFFITQYVQQKSFNGNVLLLTATPFTNSPLEVFTMLSFLNYNYLKLIKLGNLKNFFDNFAIVKIEVVINTQLEPVRKQIFVGWANVVGLQDLIFKFMDKATKEMEEKAVDRPNKIVLPLNKKEINGVEYQLADTDAISTTLALTPMQLSLWETLKLYAEGEIDYEDLLDTKNLTTCGKIATREKVKSINDEGEEVEEEVVSLKYINDKKKGAMVRSVQCLTYGRQLAVTPYLYRFSGQQDEPTAKQYVQSSPKFLYTMACIKSVKEYHESKGTRMSGQIIFMNIGTLCFHYLAEYLVNEIGYKENEVAIISGTNSRIGNKKYTKSQVQDKYLGRYFNEEEMNFEDIDDSERVKVLIGSASIQEGLNLQRYSSVLYNLYIGFNPTDQIQLEGRIWRQGNQYNNVRIVIPLMENSMDIFMFQKLQEKTQRINEIWARTGKNEIDTTEFNAEELKYELITNSYTLARFTLDEDKQKIDDEINDLNYQFSTIKNIAQIYKTISSFYQDGQKYSNVTIKNFFEYTRVGYMYAILKTFRADLVPLPMFIDDISERGNDISLQTYTTFISAQGKQKKYSFSDKMLNYKVKDIIDLMVQFRKDSKIYVPKGYKYENFIKPTFEKKDIITFNAPITTKDKKGVEKTEIKKLEGVVKLINDDNTADDYLEVFVKGYEDFFEVALKDIVIVEKTQKEFYNIGTKEFTDNFLPISYFQFMNNILENSNYKDKIYDVFETISYADDYVNLREKQVDFIEEYKGNIDEPTFWALIESNLFDQRLTSNDYSSNYDNYKYVDVYSYSYLKEFNNVEKAERDILKPKGINNEEELASRLEQLTLDIKQKGEEKQEIDSTDYLNKKVGVIEQMRQKQKEDPLRKASTFLQRAKEFQTANAEYKGNEYLDDIKIAEVKVEKTIEVTAKVIKTLTIDDRIKGLKIVLKLAKGDNKALIEKRIKGLEIVKKTQKFGYGGGVDNYINAQSKQFRLEAKKMKMLYEKKLNIETTLEIQGFLALNKQNDRLSDDYLFYGESFSKNNLMKVLEMFANADYISFDGVIMGKIDNDYVDVVTTYFEVSKLKGKFAKGGNVVRISVLNELYNLKDEGVTQVQLNGFNESIGYVIGLRLDDTEIKKVGNNAYITLYKTGGSVDEWIKRTSFKFRTKKEAQHRLDLMKKSPNEYRNLSIEKVFDIGSMDKLNDGYIVRFEHLTNTYATGGNVMSNKANGILYSTDGTQKTINFAGKFAPLKELQKLVGGYIELIYLKDNMILVVNEDGLGYNLPSNKNATKIVVSQNKGYGIVGNAFLINSKYIN